MTIRDLIPWKSSESKLPVRRRQEEDAFLDLRTQMNRMFDDFFDSPFELSPFFGEKTFADDFSPRMDISETEKEIMISAELPGLEPEDINISMSRGSLTISGEKSHEKDEKDKHFYRVERSFGSFRRSIPLPNEVDEDKIDATFKRGVLKVKLPKTQATLERSKRISIKTG